MTASKRPLSPHLQVYKPQMTSFTSIMHRATGLGLAAGAVFVTLWLWAVMEGGDMFTCFQTFSTSPAGKIMIFLWLLALTYHFMNGIRHMIWDTGTAITIKFANTSGWFVLVASLVSTLLIWKAAQ